MAHCMESCEKICVELCYLQRLREGEFLAKFRLPQWAAAAARAQRLKAYDETSKFRVPHAGTSGPVRGRARRSRKEAVWLDPRQPVMNLPAKAPQKMTNSRRSLRQPSQATAGRCSG